MKKYSGLLVIIASLFLIIGCSGKGGPKKDTVAVNDTTTVPDTGFTGIKKYQTSQGYILKEVTFKNGVRQGLMKTFYQGGQLYQTFWYENGLKEDSARWYYLEGQVFRATPFKHDTVDGIQKQYYRNGRVRAKIGYSKGLRTQLFQEFNSDGKPLGGYPQMVIDIKDEYSTKGLYHIGLALSDNSKKVKFYRGEFTGERFDTARCKIIKTVDGKGLLDLKKSGSPQSNSVGIIAEITTVLGNRLLSFKKVDLPYNDLK
jgi:hypothetical protein